MASVTITLTNIQTHGHHQMEQKLLLKLGDDSWKFILNQDLVEFIRGTIATNSDVATAVNTKPIASSQDYTSTKRNCGRFRNESAVTISDAEDIRKTTFFYITRISNISFQEFRRFMTLNKMQTTIILRWLYTAKWELIQ